MSQPKGKTNFRTYEASTRLLAAVIASTNVKLDYNVPAYHHDFPSDPIVFPLAEIAKHVGGGVGVDAINHRFRPIKQLAKMQAECVKKGEDPGELPTDKGVIYIVSPLSRFHPVQRSRLNGFPSFTTPEAVVQWTTALAANFGADATAVGLQHRLRPMIQLAKLQLDHRKKGKDPGELPTEKGEIQKLFGESTPGGIEWQFGGIKRLGKAQQEAVKKGENPATLTIQAPGTPSAGRGRGRPPTTRTPGTGTGRKRKTMANLLPLDSSDENGGADDNDSDFVETPSNRPSKRAATASANKKSGSQSTPTASPANAVTGNPAATMISGLAPISMPRASIFGGGDARAPTTKQSAEPFDDDIKTSGGFNTQCHDWTPRPATKPALIKTEPVVGANSFISSVNSFNSGPYYGEEYDEGEV
ncbi:hypothetical protein F4680DRAFT_454678 [Xylaria scruposa]|nr:hypothetical protein F4680DRAFT_454678 [Xylaria scruposa]